MISGFVYGEFVSVDVDLLKFLFGSPVLTDWRAFVSWKIATLCGYWT